WKTVFKNSLREKGSIKDGGVSFEESPIEKRQIPAALFWQDNIGHENHEGLLQTPARQPLHAILRTPGSPCSERDHLHHTRLRRQHGMDDPENCHHLRTENLEKVSTPFLTCHGMSEEVTAPESTTTLCERAKSYDKKLK
ncbi:hypothetical protein KI387_018813, partial [Taxus chinensis]